MFMPQQMGCEQEKQVSTPCLLPEWETIKEVGGIVMYIVML